MPCALSQMHNGHVLVSVLNPHPYPVRVRRGQLIGEFHPMNEEEYDVIDLSEDLHQSNDPLRPETEEEKVGEAGGPGNDCESEQSEPVSIFFTDSSIEVKEYTDSTPEPPSSDDFLRDEHAVPSPSRAHSVLR